jgi:hypothetical protein
MKNYTSQANPGVTAARIELILAKFGANRIQKEYKCGEIDAMVFELSISPERTVAVRLPANVNGVERFLSENVRQYRNWSTDRLRAQAQRTAWKIQQEWVEIQLSMIEMHQLDPLQVFLPYVWDGQRTYYAALKDGGFKMLPEKAGTK